MTDATTTNNHILLVQRHAYLRRMRTNRQENRPVVYLHETWVNAHDGKDCAWVERDNVTGGTLGGIRKPAGKGAQLIILGAGSETGWIPNTTLIFRSKKNTGDYHDEMTADHFEEWLLPNFSLMFNLTVLLSWIMPHIIVVVVTLSQ